MIAGGYQQGGAAGAISGGLGGATAALALGAGPWGAVAAGLGAAILSFFGGEKEDLPWTNVQYIGPGASWAGGERGIATRGQEMTAREDKIASMAIGATYRDLNRRWRDLIRSFQDLELFDHIRDLPEIIDEEFQMTAKEFETWLKESKLPTMFQHTYGKALRMGLRDLGMTGEAIKNMFAELRDMPGTERLDALNALVAGLRAAGELLKMDFAEIEGRAGETMMDQFARFAEEAGKQMELLTAGWEDMSITDRAQDLEKVSQIFESFTQTAMQAIQQLDAMARQLNSQFEGMIRGFETRGMEAPDLWEYLEAEYKRYQRLLQETDDPALIVEYSNRLAAILQQASGLIPDETWFEQAGTTGMTWQEWFIQMTRGAQEAADEAIQEQRARIEDTYEQMFAGFDDITQRFHDLAAGPVDGAGDALDGLGESADGARDALDLLRNELENLHGKSAQEPNPTSASSKSSVSLAVAAPQPPTINNNVYVEPPEPPAVIVNINGSLSQLDARIETAVVQYNKAMRAAAGKAVSSKGALS
jgi:TolA-binding protein